MPVPGVGVDISESLDKKTHIKVEVCIRDGEQEYYNDIIATIEKTQNDIREHALQVMLDNYGITREDEFDGKAGYYWDDTRLVSVNDATYLNNAQYFAQL